MLTKKPKPPYDLKKKTIKKKQKGNSATCWMVICKTSTANRVTSCMSQTTLLSASSQKCTEQLGKKSKQQLQKAWFCTEKFRTLWMLTPKSKFGEVARKDQYTRSAFAMPFDRKWSSKAAPGKLQHTEREPVLWKWRAGLFKGISKALTIAVKSRPSFWQNYS